jgi:hypothetical protein
MDEGSPPSRHHVVRGKGRAAQGCARSQHSKVASATRGEEFGRMAVGGCRLKLNLK